MTSIKYKYLNVLDHQSYRTDKFVKPFALTQPDMTSDLEKVVEPGNLVPRNYLGCKKIFSRNPVLLSKIKSCVANPALLEL